MATWEDVRRICLALPDVEERKQTFRTNGRIFVNMSHEEGAISTRAPDHERDLLIRARPDVYFVTPRLNLRSTLGVNTVEVTGPLTRDMAARSFYTSSSCGVCGKGALEEVSVHSERAAWLRTNYERALAGLSSRYPSDDEAAIFHALQLVAIGYLDPADKTYAWQRRGSEILNQVLPRHRDHPGVAHYIIHADDYPSLAELGLKAARAYALSRSWTSAMAPLYDAYRGVGGGLRIPNVIGRTAELQQPVLHGPPQRYAAFRM